MNKKEIYSKNSIVESYNSWRFGGKSGKYVNKKEIDTVAKLIHGEDLNNILDIACGTGRVTKELIKFSGNVTGLDYSKGMLKIAKKNINFLVRGDVFELPFKSNSFSGVIITRFFQHYANLETILKEIKRIVKQDGFIIFDVLKWSPRNVIMTEAGKVYRHNKKEIITVAKKLGLKVNVMKAQFLFSPGIYRFIPFRIITLLDKIEHKTPETLLVRTFWKLKKV